MFDNFDYEGLLINISDILSSLLTWSNIILSITFFLLANLLINSSQKFEIKQDNLVSRVKKIENQTKYGVLFLSSLSILSLFCIFQTILLFCFNFLPTSPFLDIVNEFHLLIGTESLPFYFDYNQINSLNDITLLIHIKRFTIVMTITISFISFILFILGFYTAIFKKLVGKKTKGHYYSIGCFALTCFFGLPLMLRVVSFNI